AVSDGLASLLRRSAEPHLHHAERLARGKHMVVPRPRMVGMAVGHDRALGAAIRVDVEAAGAAIEALSVDCEPGFKAFGSHLLSGGYRTRLSRGAKRKGLGIQGFGLRGVG